MHGCHVWPSFATFQNLVHPNSTRLLTISSLLEELVHQDASSGIRARIAPSKALKVHDALQLPWVADLSSFAVEK
jgi:hypothetical protein